MASTLTDDRSFVFTDIELSSAHWRRDETAMSRVMPLHNELIEAAFSASGGTILRGEGDSCAAMFESPVTALVASGAVQQGLAAAAWDVDLKVRIGIHSGRVYHLYGTEYGGTPLNYLGRLHKAGHGGQILVSDESASLLREQLPPRWELIDLGEFVLKDFPRRHIFQAVHADLPRHFPPLNAMRPIHGPNLPDNAFVGRDHELTVVPALLHTGRCTTVTGPAGIGKTRLALEIARRLRDGYRDGVCVVELAGVEADAQVPAAVANALHIDPQLEATVELSIVRSLASRSLLLILDNCERVSAVAASLAGGLCALGGIDVLATSRVPLGLPDEHVYPLRPLDHPDADASVARTAGSSAVQLFVERMELVRPGFALDAASARHVSEICRCVAGIPLSIELAAAAARSIPLELMAEELRASGVVPTTMPEGARARAAIDWSIDSLSAQEAEVLRTLAVFPGGASADLVDAVHPGAWDRHQLLAMLDALVQRSLAQLEDSAAGGHFRLLEPLRLTALQRIDGRDRVELEARHADVISTLVADAEGRLQSDDEPGAVDDLDRLFASLRTSIQRDSERDPDRAARVLLASHEFCFLRMRYEMYAWTEALQQRDDLSPATSATLAALSGLASFNRGDLETARNRCQRSIELSEQTGAVPHVYARFGLIAAFGLTGDYRRAQGHFIDALSWCTDTKRDYFLVNTLVLGAMSMTIQGDTAVGRKLASNAVDVAERIGNPSSLAWALCAVADAERLASPGAAHMRIEEALTLARSVRSRWVESEALLTLAKLCWQSNAEEAAVALMDAFVNAEQTGNPIHGRQAMRVGALLLGRLGCVEAATMLLDPTRRDATALPLAPDVTQGLDEVRAACTKALGADMFEAYAGRGRRMPDRELLALARRALTDAVQA